MYNDTTCKPTSFCENELHNVKCLFKLSYNNSRLHMKRTTNHTCCLVHSGHVCWSLSKWIASTIFFFRKPGQLIQWLLFVQVIYEVPLRSSALYTEGYTWQNLLGSPLKRDHLIPVHVKHRGYRGWSVTLCILYPEPLWSSLPPMHERLAEWFEALNCCWTLVHVDKI